MAGNVTLVLILSFLTNMPYIPDSVLTFIHQTISVYRKIPAGYSGLYNVDDILAVKNDGMER